MRNHKYVLVFISILLIGFFLRFYRLGSVPNGLYQDETAIGYNAYLLLKNGVDEYGKSWPIYFKSFGDYKLPIYIYATIPSVAIFGLTPFAVRLPSASFGFLTIPLLYFFLLTLSKKQSFALLAAGLLAINPWHLHYSRATFEVSITLFLLLFGALCLWYSLQNKRKGLFFIGTFAFLLSLYSYNINRLLSPFLYIVCIYMFYDRKSKLSLNKEQIITLFTHCVLLLPFIFTLFDKQGALSAKGTILFTSGTIQAPLIEFRSYIISLPTIIQKIFFNTFFLSLGEYAKHIAAYLSVPFFFITGSTHGNHGIETEGQFYLFEIISMLIGIILFLKQKKSWQLFLCIWAGITIAIAALTREAPHATRSFFLLLPTIAVSAYGFQESLRKISSFHKLHKMILYGIISIVSVASVSHYFASYYLRFPIAYAKSWRSVDRDIAQYLQENETKYDHILIDKESGLIYTSLLFYQKVSPRIWLDTVKRAPDDSEGFSEVLQFGRYEFRTIDWTKDYKQEKTLIVTNEATKPKGLATIQLFNYPTKPVVISVKEKILQFPVTDNAYSIVVNQ